MCMHFCPCERLRFCIKKTIDDNGIALSRISPGRARGFPIDHIRSTVDGHTDRIRKDNFAAVGNFLWVDSGPGSLRHALANANNLDTINFAVTGTIALTSGGIPGHRERRDFRPGLQPSFRKTGLVSTEWVIV